MAYSRTQHGPWHYILVAFTLLTLAGAWLCRGEPGILILLLSITAIFALCGLAFASLTIRDEGDRLTIVFGPLPLFRKTIRYSGITEVEVGRTSIIDGWGIHYVIGRGWTYNIWGFACVKLSLGRKIVRIGTDDAENLASLIRSKLGMAGTPKIFGN